MPETTGLLLKQLFEQTAANHRQNVEEGNRRYDMLEAIRQDIAQIRTEGALTNNDVTTLKNWRIVDVDPTLQKWRNAEQQMVGGSKLIGYAKPVVLGATGAGGVVWFKPIMLWIMSIFH